MFEYQLLARLVQDCEYFLNWGFRNEKRLWGLTVPGHIAHMKKLYKELPIKPEWLKYEEILAYEKAMS